MGYNVLSESRILHFLVDLQGEGKNRKLTSFRFNGASNHYASQNADKLIDVSRGHIDGCILAHEANLNFAEKMLNMGARVTIPTTINAISVDVGTVPEQEWLKIAEELGIEGNYQGYQSETTTAYADKLDDVIDAGVLR